MGRYDGRYRYDIRAHTKTEITVEESGEADLGDRYSMDFEGRPLSLKNNISSSTTEEELENSKRSGLGIGMGVRTQIWAPASQHE